MMGVGILAGFLSVLFMCTSYIFSRTYIRKHQSPVKLSLFSQLVMGIIGLGMLTFALATLKLPATGAFWAVIGGQTLTFLLGQTSFFMLLKEIEATRASSLIGLKLLALAVITLCLGQHLTPVCGAALLLCTVSAVGMNFSGGRISLRSCFWLGLASFSYAACDICVTKLMLMIPGKSMLHNALAVMGCCFSLLGIAVLPGLLKMPPQKNEFKDAVPYALVYLGSMFFLYVSFGLIGVVSGSIVQASRGIVSIVLGILLLRLGWEKNEPKASGKIWVRRLVMAALMLAGITLYTLNVNR